MAKAAKGRAMLTVRQVADRLNVTPLTVRRYMAAGALPFVRLPSGVLRVDAQVFEEWLAARERTA